MGLLSSTTATKMQATQCNSILYESYQAVLSHHDVYCPGLGCSKGG